LDKRLEEFIKVKTREEEYKRKISFIKENKRVSAKKQRRSIILKERRKILYCIEN